VVLNSRGCPLECAGCRAFEDPGFGYRKRFTTLEAHRQALPASGLEAAPVL
jgi:hypothetical protein